MDNRINLLILGSGIREHVWAWRAKKSLRVRNVYVLPGNKAISEKIFKCPNISLTDYPGIIQFCKRKKIDVVFVGPTPLLKTELLDYLESSDVKIIAPQKHSLELATNRQAYRKLMSDHSIPIAPGHFFESIDGALAFIKNTRFPLMLKTDEIDAAPSKLCHSTDDVRDYLTGSISEKQDLYASERVIIENYIPGNIIYIPLIVSGTTVAVLPYCRLVQSDYRTVAAYTPVSANRKLQQNLERIIIVPWVHALNRRIKELFDEQEDFFGIFSLEVSLNNKGPFILDCKMQWDDLLTQILLSNSKLNIFDILLAALEGNLEELRVEWPESTVAISLPFPSYETIPESESPDCFAFEGKMSRALKNLAGIVSHGKNVENVCKKIGTYWDSMDLPDIGLYQVLEQIEDVARKTPNFEPKKTKNFHGNTDTNKGARRR